MSVIPLRFTDVPMKAPETEHRSLKASLSQRETAASARPSPFAVFPTVSAPKRPSRSTARTFRTLRSSEKVRFAAQSCSTCVTRSVRTQRSRKISETFYRTGRRYNVYCLPCDRFNKVRAGAGWPVLTVGKAPVQDFSN